MDDDLSRASQLLENLNMAEYKARVLSRGVTYDGTVPYVLDFYMRMFYFS